MYLESVKDVKIFIYKNDKEYQVPPLEGEVTWETERKSYPGKITFTVPKMANLNFHEGDRVELRVQRTTGGNYDPIFNGRIFTKSRTKDQLIKVTAYDQLRYFKNKYTFVFEGKRASEILTTILDKYKFVYDKAGIEQSSYAIASLTEDNQTLFDIVQDAMDETVMSTGDLYVLYCDNVGNVCFKNILSLQTNIVIDEDTGENFDYSSSIDENTYNEIYLYYDNKDTNKREEYIARDSDNITKWGTLRYTESVQSTNNVNDRVKKMLELYNLKTRKLKVNSAFGHTSCRAGASVIVKLALGDINVSNRMVIEKATHKFKNGEYTMDLTLSGIKEFVA